MLAVTADFRFGREGDVGQFVVGNGPLQGSSLQCSFYQAVAGVAAVGMLQTLRRADLIRGAASGDRPGRTQPICPENRVDNC